MAKSTNTRKIAKSAKTGKDVTMKFLNSHKSTTFLQTVPIKKKGSKKK